MTQYHSCFSYRFLQHVVCRPLAGLVLAATCSLLSTSNALAREATTPQQITLSTGLATPVMEADKAQNAFVRVALTGFTIDHRAQRTPLNVALVFDQSSSMSGDKIIRAKEAAIMAVGKLSADDVVSIITYDSTVDVLIPATKASDKNKIYQAINRIRAGGNTALFAGTSKGAYEVRKFLSEQRVNRVVLLSDGMANVGPDSPSELGALGKALAKDGMSVSTIGLGLGYNEDLMTQLANYSDGNHAFVENSADLARVFDQEFGDAMSVVAQDVEIEIICAEGVRPLRVVGREAEIVGSRVLTRMNQLYSAQENYVVLEVAMPAKQEGEQLSVANVTVHYNNMATQQRTRLSDRISASFSASQAKVKAAINEPIYESAVEQVANEVSQEAVALRDSGDVDAASARLQANSSFLSSAADYISSPKLRQQSLEAKQEAEVVQSRDDWNKTRKVLKEKSYKRAKQQR